MHCPEDASSLSERNNELKSQYLKNHNCDIIYYYLVERN